jgi:hypothetical protein
VQTYSTKEAATCPVLALMAGVSAKQAWAWAKAGFLGQPVGKTPDGDALYSVQALERHLGRRIDPIVLGMVLEVRMEPKPQRKASGRPPKDHSHIAAFGSIAQRNMRAAIAMRDAQWLALIEAGAPDLLAEARALAAQPF